MSNSVCELPGVGPELAADVSPASEIAALRECLAAMDLLKGRVRPMSWNAGRDAMQARIDQLRSLQRGVVFWRLSHTFGDERWLIHSAGEPPREYLSPPSMLVAAWLAMQNPGRRGQVRTCDFAEPGARRPDTIVRTGIRKTAADWVERTTGCLPLASALRSIRVDRGVVLFDPPANAPPIDCGT